MAELAKVPVRRSEVRPLEGPVTAEPQVLALVNGRWFDGSGFRPRTVYVVGDTFAFDRPARVDSTLDLGGGFVVPPFGEAHSQNVEPIGPVDERLAAYLRDGVFSVKNPNSLPATRAALAGKIGSRIPRGFACA